MPVFYIISNYILLIEFFFEIFRCDEVFGDLPVMKNVPEMERREVFEDAMVNLAKKEKEKAKSLRKRNTTRLTDILDRMTNIKFNTTWTQAKQMLLDNPAFAEDDELLAMDKEVFLYTNLQKNKFKSYFCTLIFSYMVFFFRML